MLRRLARRAAFRVATSDAVERAVLAMPLVRDAALRCARRYVAGLHEDDALRTADELAADGLSASIDVFGENTSDGAAADRIADGYVELAGRIAEGTYLALDCSNLALDADPAGCQARVAKIAAALPPGARVQLGAEESARADATFALARAVAADAPPVMVTVQSNLRRSDRDVEELAAAGIPIRLVKGAYVEDPAVSLPWGPPTDAAFVALAERLAALGADHALATHDPQILARLTRDRTADVEFLLGVRPDAARQLAAAGHRVRIYVPFGARWFRYYARRVAESIGS
jgi:proline dehydrogenase